MNSNYDQWVKCRKCGSFFPADWQRCGRCGQPVKGKSGIVRGIKLLLIALALAIGYSCKSEIVSLWEDVKNKITEVSDKSAYEENVSESQGISLPDINKSEPPQLETEEPKEKSPDATAVVEASSSSSSSPATVTTTNVPSVKKAESTPTPEPKPAKDSQYNRIYDALMSAKDSTLLPNDSKSDEVFDMIQKIVINGPRIQFYEGCSYRSDGLLTLKYSKPKDFILKADSEVKKKSEEIISTVIKPGMTDFEKELALHDYIVNNCSYDSENLKAQTIPPESHAVYGVLINQKAVCEGYAKAMKLLLDMAGVESMVVTGNSMGQSHAWNLVKLDGKWYHTDATWDDPVMADGGQIRQYTYFNLTDSEIGRDHTWDKNAYPVCDSEKYNYFTYFGNIVSSSDDFLKALIKGSQDGNNHVSVKISDYSAERYDIPYLIQQAATLLDSDASYSIDEDHGVVEVWFKNGKEETNAG